MDPAGSTSPACTALDCTRNGGYDLRSQPSRSVEDNDAKSGSGVGSVVRESSKHVSGLQGPDLCVRTYLLIRFRASSSRHPVISIGSEAAKVSRLFEVFHSSPHHSDVVICSDWIHRIVSADVGSPQTWICTKTDGRFSSTVRPLSSEIVLEYVSDFVAPNHPVMI